MYRWKWLLVVNFFPLIHWILIFDICFQRLWDGRRRQRREMTMRIDRILWLMVEVVCWITFDFMIIEMIRKIFVQHEARIQWTGIGMMMQSRWMRQVGGNIVK